ncbi:gypsy type transposase [Tanacetum coccineum]
MVHNYCHEQTFVIGLSLKSQELTAIFLGTRLYCSYVMEYDVHTLLDLATLTATVWVIYMMRLNLNSSYMHEKDNISVLYVVVPCALLSLVVHPTTQHYIVNRIIWAFCVYLESVSVLPQLRVMQNTKIVEPFTAHYVFALGVARFLSCAHWILQVLDTRGRLLTALGYGMWPSLVLLSEIVQTFILADFCYYYVQSVVGGRLVLRLPSGVVDAIQLEDVVSTISQEYLLEFTSEYGIPKSLHPELPGSEEPIMEFTEGKVGVYTKFFEFANFRIPISQFLFDILGHYQIHLSQLSVIGAAKVSHFEINCRVLNIIPTLNLFRVFYVPSYNSGWMSFSKRPGKNTAQCYTKPLDSLKNWNNRFFWVDERIFPTVVEWRTNAPKDEMPSTDSYSAADVTALNTHHMDLFNLISAPNPTKVKTGTRPRAAQEVPLLTATVSRVIDMEDTTVMSGSLGTPSALEKSPLDFANENPPPLITKRGGMEDQIQDGLSHEILHVENPTTTKVILELDMEKEVVAIGPLMNKRRRKRGNDKADTNSPPKVLRKDHAAFRPTQSTLGGKSLASMGLEAGSTFFTPATQETPADAKSVSDPDPLSYAKSQPHPERDVA